jgi:peptidoglycan/LPS O-acetylase OafA/YrhL
LAPASDRNIAISYLRAFITVLVLAHHAVLAYHPYAPALATSLVAQPRWWQAFPVVDSHRWSVFSMFVGFNDIFFMSLMFLLSGLFVWKSLQRKRSGVFLRDRALRLGLPFVVAAALIAPVAYYPAYLQTGARGFAGFLQQWRSLGNWPAGPAWFIWLLLAFDCVAVLLFQLAPKCGEALGRFSKDASRRPMTFFVILVAVSAIAYIPMELVFNGFSWSSFGPFTLQTSRLLHYFVYFLAGIGIGAYGLDRGLLRQDGNLARRWFRWAPAALLTFVVAIIVIIVAITNHSATRFWEVMADVAFVVSCAVTSFAFLAVFVRFGAKRSKMFDSLSANAYGMYLVHYAFVSWLQYALLPASLSAVAKAAFVFFGTLALSWGTVAALRRIPVVAKVI